MKIYPLAMHVIVVAHEREDGWCAYIDAVPGQNHQNEAQRVLDYGEKLPEHIAIAMFGEQEIPYAR